MFDIGFADNEIVSHIDICHKTHCGCMGGIRYSSKNNLLLLFITEKSKCENKSDGDILKYMGSGKGNQSLDRMVNKRLANSIQNNTEIYLFKWVDSERCKFIGKMCLAGDPYYEMWETEDGDKERKVIFPLKKIN